MSDCVACGEPMSDVEARISLECPGCAARSGDRSLIPHCYDTYPGRPIRDLNIEVVGAGDDEDED